jgi:hypothetical protein
MALWVQILPIRDTAKIRGFYGIVGSNIAWFE